MRNDVAARFWAKVDKTGECWLWTGYVMPNGYGQFRLDGKARLVHRISARMVAEIPEGMHIDHTCRVRRCVNPAHLQAVTQQQNNEHRVVNPRARSGVRGVCWDEATGKWRVLVGHQYRKYTAGRFADLAEAEAAAIALRNRLMTNNLQDRAA